MSHPDRITYFAQTDQRGQRVRFGIKSADRTKHMYVIGKSGMGKSTLLENMAIQDIRNGEGLAFFDPHGASAEKILDYVPEHRIKDVILFAPYDMDHPVGFNIMEDVGYDKRHLVVAGLMSAFKKIWVDAWSSRMEYILENTLLALLEYPDTTLLDVNRMLIDKTFRKKVVENLEDPLVKSFWTEEFAKYTDRYTQEATPAIQNKVGQFTSNPLIRNIVGQPKSSFDLRELIDERKIFIADLSKGRIGEKNAQLLGSMLVTKFYLSAMSRADANEAAREELPNFYFYVDEFQSFANESFADILSEARKYKLNLIIAHQYIEQMPEEVRAAVFGNVGTMVTFRVGAYDAEVLEKEFAPFFASEDLVNLGFTQIYLKLMIDGVSSAPFSATTLPPLEATEESHRDALFVHSREAYSRGRADVEAAIRARGAELREEEERAREKERPRGASAPSRAEKKPPAAGGGQRTGASASKREAPPHSPEKPKTPAPPAQPPAQPAQTEKFSKKPTPGSGKPAPEGGKPTSEKRHALRDALADALADRKARGTAKEGNAPAPAPATPRTDAPQKAQHPPAKSAGEVGQKAVPEGAPQKPPMEPSPRAAGTGPQEVPESVLRKVLEVDESDPRQT